MLCAGDDQPRRDTSHFVVVCSSVRKVYSAPAKESCDESKGKVSAIPDREGSVPGRVMEMFWTLSCWVVVETC